MTRPSDKPHVLTLTDVIGHGGAERVAEVIALGADPRRYRRSLCVTRPALEIPGIAAAESLERLRAGGVEVLLLDRRHRFDLRPFRRLARFVRAERVDLIHAHKFGSNVWAAVLGRLLRVPVVIAHEHTWSFEGQPVRRFLDRNLVGRFCDAVIAVSDADRRRMIDIVGMRESRVVLIPNGIEWTNGGDGAAIRAELGIAADVPVIVQIAVLRAQKAIDVMLEAMAVLRARCPEVCLLVAGPGDPVPLERLAAQLGLTENVRFLGPRADVHDLLAAADVGALSSDFEGMPLAVLEYMAAGLPVVATQVGGLPQMVTDGTTGLLVPPREPAALAAAIAHLIDDPATARAMGSRGRERQHAEFSSDSMNRRVAGLYERLLESRKRRAAFAVPRSSAAGR